MNYMPIRFFKREIKGILLLYLVNVLHMLNSETEHGMEILIFKYNTLLLLLVEFADGAQ